MQLMTMIKMLLLLNATLYITFLCTHSTGATEVESFVAQATQLYHKKG